MDIYYIFKYYIFKIHVIRYGPRSSKRSMVSDEGSIYCEFKFAPFSCNKRCGYIRVNI